MELVKKEFGNKEKGLSGYNKHLKIIVFLKNKWMGF